MQPFLAFLLLLATPVLNQQDVDTLIVGGQVFQTDSGKFVPNTGITIKDGRFLKIGADPDQVSAKQTVKLGNDKFLLPGLVDCHAHYNVRLIKKRREEFSVMPVIYLANGATVTLSLIHI